MNIHIRSDKKEFSTYLKSRFTFLTLEFFLKDQESEPSVLMAILIFIYYIEHVKGKKLLFLIY